MVNVIGGVNGNTGVAVNVIGGVNGNTGGSG